MIKKEHKINPIPNYIDITKVDITKWEDGLYTLGLDKDKGLVILEKPIYSSDGAGSRALYDDGTYKPTYDKEGIDKLLEGLEQTQNDNLELIKGLQNNIKENKGNININKESIEALKDANKVYDKIIETLKSDIKENDNNIININKSITDINEKLDKGTADINEVNEAIFKINNKIIAINKKIEELQTNVNNIKTNIINIEKDISSIKFKIESIDKNYKLADQKIVDDYKKAVGTLRDEVRKADNEIIKAYKEADQKIYTKLDSDIKECNESLEKAVNELNDTKVDKTVYEEDLASLEEYKESQSELNIKQDIGINKNLQNINQLNDMIKLLSQKDEPIMTAEGVSIISLPNNVMKSVTPNYRIEGLTLQNLTSSYIADAVRCYIESSEGGMFNIVRNDGDKDAYITLNGNFALGDTIYLSANFKNSATIRTGLINGSNIQLSQWAESLFSSSLITIKEDSNLLSRVYVKNGEVGDSFLFYVSIINLTQTFGAGNEPTKEWCDEHINSYFEGTKSVTAPLRIKSEVGGRNLVGLFSDSYTGNDAAKGYGVYFIRDGYEFIAKTTYPAFAYKVIVPPSTTLTLSLDLEIDMANPEAWFQMISNKAGGGTEALSPKIKKSGRYTFTFLSNANGEDNRIGFIAWDNTLQTSIKVSNVKLEKGNKATPWTPAPEDNQPATGGTLYINNNLELKSVGEVKDYIENGKLYKYISDDGEILEQPEIINLDTTGQIINHPNGTIVIEPITNKTAYYNKGLDISDYNIKEIEYMQIFEENSYQDLDISKIEIKDNILTHPNIESGIVFISYYYDNTPIYSSNTVDYYNLDNTLKSPDGSIWNKVYEIDNEGKITLKGEKL